MDRSSGNTHAFVPVRMMLNDFKCDYFNHVTNGYHETDLKIAIENHLKLLCKTYYNILVKSINTIYKNNVEKIKSLTDLAEPFGAMVNHDARLLKIQNSGDFIIIKVISPSKD